MRWKIRWTWSRDQIAWFCLGEHAVLTAACSNTACRNSNLRCLNPEITSDLHSAIWAGFPDSTELSTCLGPDAPWRGGRGQRDSVPPPPTCVQIIHTNASSHCGVQWNAASWDLCVCQQNIIELIPFFLHSCFVWLAHFSDVNRYQRPWAAGVIRWLFVVLISTSEMRTLEF